MKQLTLLVLVFTMTSCDEPTLSKKKSTETYGHIGGSPMEEIEYEGCQYIGSFNAVNSDWGTHKGNCTNPIHNQNHVTVVDTVEYQLIRK